MRALFQQNNYYKTYGEMQDIVFNSQYDINGLHFADEGKFMDVTYLEKALWVAPNKGCNSYIGSLSLVLHSWNFWKNYVVWVIVFCNVTPTPLCLWASLVEQTR